ncbi:hypothetical protein [Chryseobacterium turcicum]|uniref:Uncharacterized protein n=1 Tax=Chryseobacterium turcicum TaxID=2898076 RepID=A0A9Q3V4Q1_9FLAO|nr:hypothetical protein [Chryseobacterium turcicum]MCD1117245.1 hypothetical protein [Chryseobacterium turcicum]
MNKILQLLSLLIILCGNFCLGQNLNDIEKLASNYNKTFDVLEKTMNIKPFDRGSKFGLESRVYNLKAFKILVESNNEENKISKISILTEKTGNNDELWYNIAKAANANKEYKFINSFVSGSEDDIYEKDIDFNAMVNILRKSKSLGDYTYSIAFKKDNLYYNFNMASKTFFSVIDENLKERD